MIHSLQINAVVFAFAILVAGGCSGGSPTRNGLRTTAASELTKVPLQPLTKLSVNGDFDGDGRRDILVQHLVSRRKAVEIDSAPDPEQTEFETQMHWYSAAGACVYLSCNSTRDTLYIGFAQGLYCLINIGDNNGDKRDEIALVVNELDMSRVNSCRIYSLCNNRWTRLESFMIHEEAFDRTEEIDGAAGEITGFLEKHDRVWMVVAGENAAMTPLQVPKCD